MRCRTMRHIIHDILSKSVYLTLILDVPKSDKFPIIAVKDSNDRTLVDFVIRSSHRHLMHLELTALH